MSTDFALAIVLAAGASSRMGQLKALMPVAPGGDIAVRHLVRLMLRVCSECVVVTGYHHDEVQSALRSLERVRVVRNEEPQRGQLSSLQAGMAALQPIYSQWTLFSPVDCMAIDATVMELLRREMEAAGPDDLLCIPRHRGRRGHPVAFRSSCVSRFLALGQGESARTVIHALRGQTRYAEIPNEDFLLDVDCPEDYAHLLARQSREGRQSD